jgi:CHAT domain-containing protein/Tfp pilus assembly protein PilF
MAQGPSATTPVQLSAGEVLRGFVRQEGVDVTVVLLAPNGKQVAQFDSFEDGPDPVCFVAKETGEYRIEIRLAGQEKQDKASFVLTDAPHPAGELDLTFCRAVEEATTAKALQTRGGADALRESAKRNSVALQLWRDLGDRPAELRTLNRLATVHHALSDYQTARDSFSQALELSRSIGDRRSEGEALNGLGMSSFRLGDIQPTVDWLREAMAIWKELHFTYGEANALNNLGVLYYPMGEWQSAIDCHLRALDLVRSLGDQRGEAYTLNNLGVAYDALGESERAMSSLNDALRLFRAVGPRIAAARTLGVMGRISLAGNKVQAAIAHLEEALVISRAEGDRRTEAEALERIGEAWERRGDIKKASDSYNEALAEFRSISNRQGEAVALHQLGLIEVKQGAAESGIRLLDQALKIRSDIGLRDKVAATLSDMARVERDRGDLASARQRIESALDQIEALRTRVAGLGLRSSYFASKQDSYAFYVDLLMRLHRSSPALGFDHLAFNAAERSRARTLLDVLTEMRSRIRRGADPALLKREEDLEHQLNFQSSQLLSLASSGPTAKETELRRKVEDALASLQQIEARICTESPLYAALMQPEPVSIDEIQDTILDPDTLLLEYSLGTEASYLWVVGVRSIHSYRLPRGPEIETLAAHLIEAANQRQDSEEYARAASALSNILLGPAADLLGKKRLLVLADGGLLSVPFAALPVPGKKVPIIVDHEVVSLPSISALAHWRRGRSTRQPSQKAILILADPVFDRDDPRVPAPQNSSERGGQQLPLARLLFSRDEANAVASSVPASLVKLALGFEAKKCLLLEPQAAQFRVIHIATHGLLDARDPELSGLMLSRVDASGREQDGFLRLYEIFNLDLSADLAVLSACRSGLGKTVRGEGILGLTRAFMYAGVPRVVVTQWNVDDEATAELMRLFYAFQFGPRHLRPAAALRAAQVALWESPRWHTPYYWGAFVFHGEWR